ncbi:MAG: 4Fe-4S binding protein [Sulfurimonadaceae bacterium]|jgi:polyferredoxin|nr:4Fe-4S binding protein [Sulfurimonadaceae bacterium]
MVTHVKRDNNDIFNKPLLGFIFKNRKFLFALRVVVVGLFFYAIYYGFIHQGKENLFTGALFWGIFWSLFMVATLPSFGRIFCGICPHGFLGKYITAFGLKKTMPKWMQNRYIGIALLVIGWWGIYYTFPSFWKSPLTTAMLFGAITLVAFLLYYIYKDMSYCKYICPIGTLTRAYDKLSFTKLESYTQHCQECSTFECATACPYNLKPFSFAKKNQADDCTLCMECAHACEAIKFTITKPSEQLFSKFKTLHAEVWTYILILGSIPISMNFAHGLNRSKIADTMIWNQTATSLGMGEYAGGFAFLYALLFTIFFAVLGLYIASKVLKKEYKTTFATLGYAYAPLFILGSLGHTLGTFFTHDYQEIVGGFTQAFGGIVEVAPLAKRGDAWLVYFGLLKWLGVVWALILLYKRLKLIEATSVRKVFGYIFASTLIIFFIGISAYSAHILKSYGTKERMNHGMSMPMDDCEKCKTHVAPLAKIHHLGTSTPIYFSLTNPTEEKKGGMHMGMGMRDKNAIATQNIWLVYKKEAKKLLSSEDIEMFFYDTKGKFNELTNLKFEVPLNGYYNLYAINETHENGVLVKRVAKLEHLRGSHGGEDIYTEDVKKRVTTQKTKIDLIRLKNDDEKSFFYKHAMGDLLTFEALFDGMPLANANLQISMDSGWIKELTTDADGIAKFHIIRDYFPEWGEFDKRYKGEMLLTLTHMPSENEKYILTYPLLFSPNSSDYTSYLYALILMTLTLFVSGVIVYRFRRNRTQPFSELRYEK